MNLRNLVACATLALAVVLAVMTLGGSPTKAALATCTVPGTHATIQGAVNDLGCSTINVASGSYTENVIIFRSLTLNGAQAGVDARTRSGPESVINGGSLANITITADGVTVDGFTLNGPVSQGTAAIVMMGANTGETIQNNIVNNPGRAASFNTSNTVFKLNAVLNTFATAGDGFQANSSPVQNVTISDNNFSGADGNIYNADITIIEGNSNIVVSGNFGNGDGTLLALFKTNGAQITGNTVVGDGGSSAIYIGGGDSNVIVDGNQVTSAGSAVRVTNAFGVGLNSSVTIMGNTLYNNASGVSVGANSVTGTVQAHRNSLTGNTLFGISNDPSSGGLVSGTCNWWGAASGPGPIGSGTGDKVSTGVTFAPWLVSADLNGPCIGGNVATNKDQCKNDGWKTRVRADNTPFKNQGDCIQFVNTGK